MYLEIYTGKIYLFSKIYFILMLITLELNKNKQIYIFRALCARDSLFILKHEMFIILIKCMHEIFRTTVISASAS